MSHAMLRMPGSCYLFSRRVDRREFRLRPGQGLDGAIGIVIAKAAEAAGVVVVQLVVMSNRIRAVLWDPEGRVSDFLRDAVGAIACVANHAQERRGQFWRRCDGRELTPLCDVGALEDAVASSYLSPTAAGLVARPSAWPGINTRIEDIGSDRAVDFERDAAYFREGGPVPMRMPLRLGLPHGVDAVGFRSRVRAIVDRKVAEYQEEARRESRGFLGYDGIMATDIFASPTTLEHDEAGSSDRVAARDPELKEQATERLRLFERAYAACARRIARGERDVLLPAGTYHLWRHRGFHREDDPPPEAVFKAA